MAATAEKTKTLVTGAGGFIGSFLGKFLKQKGYWVRGVDIKMPAYMREDEICDEFLSLDLRRWENCLEAVAGIDEIYALAADMGGMGFISGNHAQILHNNSLISIHTLEAARARGIKRYLYTRSACIYPEYKQLDTNVVPLKESDAYPAQPQDAYGWEKLLTERLCTHYRQDYGLEHALSGFTIYSASAVPGAEGGKGSGRAMPQDRISEAHRCTGNRNLGRWRADSLVLLHRRLRGGHLQAHAVGLARSVKSRPRSHGDDQ